MMARVRKSTDIVPPTREYDGLVGEISALLEQSRRTTARTINSILTATYWEIGRRIVEFEQGGEARAEYGTELLKRLAADLTARFGRGFSRPGLQRMRAFYQGWEICSTPSSKFEARVRLPAGLLESAGEAPQAESGALAIVQTPSAKFDQRLFAAFPLAWSHYVRLMGVEKPHARAFYEAEAIRGGWSVRQLDRQISTQFFERTAHSKQQAALLARGRKPKRQDAVSVDDEIRDPYLLEFLNRKDEYSESELEEALIEHLEAFLLELGAGFTFVARQKRIRVGGEWYRIDLLLFHRRLKCLVVIDLKLGKFTHADAGQMSLYLTYAKQHLTEPGENDPVGIILCSGKDDAVVEYAMGGINARVFASKYLTQLPDAETLCKEIETTRRALLQHRRLEPSAEEHQQPHRRQRRGGDRGRMLFQREGEG
jgi:predicted nuclease of restriction endonuclease-like (RecB) superfamily